MQVKAFILHLERATGRQANVRRLAEACGLPSEVFPAIDGRLVDPGELERAEGEPAFEPSYPFDLSPGEAGCFLSHRAIWERIAQGADDAALIMEDDAGIEPDAFAKALDLASRHVLRLGYVQFQRRAAAGKRFEVECVGDIHLTVPQVSGLQTTTQLISRQAAARLLDASTEMDRPIDTLVQSHWHTGLRAAEIFPSGVADISTQIGGSTLGAPRRRRLPQLAWRETVRARYRLAVRRLSAKSAAPESGGFADSGEQE